MRIWVSYDSNGRTLLLQVLVHTNQAQDRQAREWRAEAALVGYLYPQSQAQTGPSSLFQWWIQLYTAVGPYGSPRCYLCTVYVLCAAITLRLT